MLLLGAMMTCLCLVLLTSLRHRQCSSFPFSVFTFALPILVFITKSWLSVLCSD